MSTRADYTRDPLHPRWLVNIKVDTADAFLTMLVEAPGGKRVDGKGHVLAYLGDPQLGEHAYNAWWTGAYG